MLDPSQQSEMQSRFGDRFSGMHLTHVELLHWPVWVHTFAYEAFESVSLDPLEEGLLRLVQAGVESAQDLSALLGCSERYVLEMIERLGGGHTHACVLLMANGAVRSTPRTSSAIEDRTRQSPVPRNRHLLRDAIFGSWLSYGDTAFNRLAVPTLDDGAHAWLEAVTDRITEDQEVGSYALTLVDEDDVESFEVFPEGKKEWVTLWLGCYQPPNGSGGRFLLFNPACEDSPLADMSVSFEQDLLSDRIQLYFQDDVASTASLFWRGLSRRLVAERKTEELLIGMGSLIEADAKLGAVSGPAVSEELDEALGGINTKEESSELVSLRKFKVEMEKSNARLSAELEAIPRTQHIEAGQHPAILVEAIDNARAVLILICPWIRMRVLRPLLPKLDKAMQRGCEIYIGYGMPKSPHHPDSTDEEALAELRKREKSGMLRLCHLNTHEKVIVQDDQRFVTSSFNFLSYTGGDGRRESGTLWLGGVAPLREKFLAVFPARPVGDSEIRR